MSPTKIHPGDVHGLARLATDATAALADVVEAMHHAIVWPAFLPASRHPGRTTGITGLVYAAVRGTARLVGSGLDVAFAPLVALLDQPETTPERDAALAVLNGVIGDHLASTGNPLHQPMVLRSDGCTIAAEAAALAAAFPAPSRRVVVMIHGLCMNERRWQRDDHDHGLALARDLGCSTVYVRYNSGLHISTNGRALAALLDDLVRHWPVPIAELALVGHSMGGLVARSACHYADQEQRRWRAHLRRIAFSRHPASRSAARARWQLDRRGARSRPVRSIAPGGPAAFAAPVSPTCATAISSTRTGEIATAAPTRDSRRPVPLPAGVACYAIAATTGERRGDLKDRLWGDGLVPVESALGAPPRSVARARHRRDPPVGRPSHAPHGLARSPGSLRAPRGLALGVSRPRMDDAARALTAESNPIDSREAR